VINTTTKNFVKEVLGSFYQFGHCAECANAQTTVFGQKALGNHSPLCLCRSFTEKAAWAEPLQWQQKVPLCAV
jgi:hypothetical protein